MIEKLYKVLNIFIKANALNLERMSTGRTAMLKASDIINEHRSNNIMLRNVNRIDILTDKVTDKKGLE